MRLNPGEIDAIKAAAHEVFGASAQVRVFGLRVDDSKRGGDLDLYIEVDPGGGTLANEDRFLDLIEAPLDALHVDLLVRERGRPLRPIEEIARRDGTPL